MDTRFFEFDGIKSSDMGVHIVRVGGGRGSVPLWGDTAVTPKTSAKRIYTDSYSVERSPLEISFTITLMDNQGRLKEWTRESKAMLSEWLVQDTFKELRLGHDVNKVYYAMLTNADPISTGNRDGYINITFTTNSPYAWSDIFYESWDTSVHKIIEIDAMHNVGDKYYYPEIEVVASSNVITIINHTESERKTIVKDRDVGENLYMDGQNKEIKSGTPLKVTFPHFNRNWFRLLRGYNKIEVQGVSKLLMKMQYPIL